MGKKNGKVPKTLHKTSQKEGWDQPQPWWFVAPTMSLSQWPTSGARVWRKKLNREMKKIEQKNHEMGSKWESKQK